MPLSVFLFDQNAVETVSYKNPHPSVGHGRESSVEFQCMVNQTNTIFKRSVKPAHGNSAVPLRKTLTPCAKGFILRCLSGFSH